MARNNGSWSNDGMRRGRLRAIAAALMIVGPSVAADRPVHEIQVAAERFAFSPSSIQVTPGEPVRLVVRSKDAVHGFAIHQLKIDVQIPKGGEPVTVDFVAPPAGQYEIACSEFCGSGHGRMKASLVSVAPSGTAR